MQMEAVHATEPYTPGHRQSSLRPSVGEGERKGGRGRSGPDQKQRSVRKRISDARWRNWRHARGLAGKGWARPLSGVFVNCPFTINMSLVARSTSSLSFSSPFSHSFVHSYDPPDLYFYFFLSIDIFISSPPLFRERLLTLLNSTTANRLILGFLTRTPTTCLQ
jgi:hypothetical protein